MSKIITKEFNNFKIRATTFDNEIWFVAKDSAELLGYKDTDKAIRQHCKKSKKISEIFNPAILEGLDFQQFFGNNFKNVKLIPEPDVWRLIIKSRLPEAEKVENWIMEEVLPSIRKTGSYSLTEQPKEKKRDDLISVSTEEMRKELEALDFLLNRVHFSEKEKIEFINKTLEKINFQTLENPHLLKHEPVFTLTQLLKDFRVDIRTADFNRKLESYGIIQRFGNGWILLDMKFGENRHFKEGTNHRYYRSTFQELLDLVIV
jgi:prophage antirepressor-like protein